MVAAGAAGAEVPATRIEGGITHGVLAMDAYLFGAIPGAAAATPQAAALAA
jgi:4,5-DOPA dioxygenase extradiol